MGAEAVFIGCAVLGGVWLLVLRGMRELPKLDNRVIHLNGNVDRGQVAERLRAVPGVLEAVVVAEQGLALLKVDGKQLDEKALEALAMAVRGG